MVTELVVYSIPMQVEWFHPKLEERKWIASQREKICPPPRFEPVAERAHSPLDHGDPLTLIYVLKYWTKIQAPTPPPFLVGNVVQQFS